jgi:hypothetical protein
MSLPRGKPKVTESGLDTEDAAAVLIVVIRQAVPRSLRWSDDNSAIQVSRRVQDIIPQRYAVRLDAMRLDAMRRSTRSHRHSGTAL